MEHDRPWHESTFIAIDLETTGKYPLDAEICEIAAVKWRAGKIIDTYQTLVKPSRPMGAEVIAIHNITNEMVAESPSIREVLPGFHKFIQDGFLMAHHAPFDMGFLAVEFEKQRLALPTKPVFCTCLLARRLVPESPNHRLVTLAARFGIDTGQAHRALDDTKACLQLGLKCFEISGADTKVTELFKVQGGDIPWSQFSIMTLKSNAVFARIIEALERKSELQITYSGGSRPGEPRTIMPLGLVRNLDDDFLVAQDEPDTVPKRYFLKRITGSAL